MKEFRQSVFAFVILSFFIITGCASKKLSDDFSPGKISDGMSKNTFAIYFYNTAERLSSAKNFEEAKRYFSRAIKADPLFAAAYMGKGILFYGIDNEKALRLLNKAVAIDKYFFSAYYNRAVVLIQLEKYEDAVSDFSRAIFLKPDYARAYYNRAHLFVKLKKTEKALNDFDRSIELKKDDPDIYFHRGLLRMNENLGDLGLSDFEKTYKMNPKDFKAVYNIACIYSMKGDFEKTETYLKKAVEAGFKELQLLKKDPDLENFRRSKNFERFWQSLKG